MGCPGKFIINSRGRGQREPKIMSEEIAVATREYLKGGGEIEKLEPQRAPTYLDPFHFSWVEINENTIPVPAGRP